MARRKRRGKNKERNNNNKKQLRFEKNSPKKGIFTVRVFGTGAELKGQVLDTKDGFVTVKYKAPNSKQILLRKILEEQLVAVNPNSIVVSGRVLVAEYFATKIVRKGNKIALITLEDEKVILYLNDATDIDISALVSVVKEEKEEDDEDTEDEEDEDEDEEDEKKSKKKKKKDDDDEEEEEEEGDDEEEDEKKSKKKKKKDDDDEEEEDEDGESEDDGEDLFNDL